MLESILDSNKMQFRQNLGTIQIDLDDIQTEFRANLDAIQTEFRQTDTDLDIFQTFQTINRHIQT